MGGLRALALLLVAFLVLSPAKCDLPIHCIMAQVEGVWKFHLGPAKTLRKIEEARCGHDAPSTVSTSMQNTPGPNFKSQQTLELKLDRYNQVYGDGGKGRNAGTWTMMYDEGFVVHHSDFSFMAFFSYSMSGGKSLSDCSKTLIGWYRDSGRQMGCFYAVQTAKTNNVASQSWGDDIVGVATVTARRTNRAIISLAETESSSLSQETLDKDFEIAMKHKNFFLSLTDDYSFKTLARSKSESEVESEAVTNEQASSGSEEKTEEHNQGLSTLKKDEKKKPIVVPEKTVKKTKVKVDKNNLQRLPKKTGNNKPSKRRTPVVKTLKANNKSQKKKPAFVKRDKKKPEKNSSKSPIAPKPTKKSLEQAKKDKAKAKAAAKANKKAVVVKQGKKVENKKAVKTKTDNAKRLKGKQKHLKKESKAATSHLSLRDEKETLPWEDPKLKINDKDYHVRRFYMNMNIEWVKPKKKKKFTQLANSESKVIYSGASIVSPLNDVKVFDSKSFVDRINKANLGWTATEYSFLAGKTFEEINNFAGRPSFARRSLKDIAQDYKQMNSFAKVTTEMPSSFTLEPHLSPPRRQRACGNCYLIASIAMLEARIHMQYGRKFPLSIQYINDCNHYAQGCNGGFAYEVLRFAQEFWAPPESCKSFYASQGVCAGHCEISKLAEVVTVDKPYYVGGFFGKTTEQLLMEELYNNGPVVVSFEPKPSFTYYKGGIYTPLEDTVQQEFNGDAQWMKVDHSVLLYGWGEEKGVKYWLIQNSWGEGWGENGNFRIVRGQNVLGIESLGEAANPRIVPM